MYTETVHGSIRKQGARTGFNNVCRQAGGLADHPLCGSRHLLRALCCLRDCRLAAASRCAACASFQPLSNSCHWAAASAAEAPGGSFREAGPHAVRAGHWFAA